MLSYIVWARAQALAFHSIDVTQPSGGSADAIVCGQGREGKKKGRKKKMPVICTRATDLQVRWRHFPNRRWFTSKWNNKKKKCRVAEYIRRELRIRCRQHFREWLGQCPGHPLPRWISYIEILRVWMLCTKRKNVRAFPSRFFALPLSLSSSGWAGLGISWHGHGQLKDRILMIAPLAGSVVHRWSYRHRPVNLVLCSLCFAQSCHVSCLSSHFLE